MGKWTKEAATESTSESSETSTKTTAGKKPTIHKKTSAYKIVICLYKVSLWRWIGYSST
jgi:hypothetical protein